MLSQQGHIAFYKLINLIAASIFDTVHVHALQSSFSVGIVTVPAFFANIIVG